MDLTTHTSPPPARDRSGVAHRIVVIYSPHGSVEGRGRVITPAQAWPIGRQDPTSVRLEPDDSQLSRSHCVVEPAAGGGFQLRDCNSTNGTWLNGERITVAPLRPLDIIRIGDHLLLYQELGLEESESLVDRKEARGLVGGSPKMALLRLRVAVLGPSSAPVLLLGETGVGKEVVARALHAAFQGTEEKPFVPVNCAAISNELAEAELFGHVKGAYTGSAGARLGLFREAHGGTLFLDEIGEMSLSLQVKLLRALETREVRPVGADRSVPVDVRVIAATNRELEREIERGAFRSDLFARLMTHVVSLPPLRERKDDVLSLLEAFFLAEGHDPSPRPSPDAAEALLCYAWPRNVRELRQTVLRITSTGGRSETLEVTQLPPEMLAIFQQRVPVPRRTPSISVPAVLLEVPKDKPPGEQDLRLVLEALNGNVSRVADFFGKDRRQIHRWLERFDIKIER